jgi:DNA-binding NarL/FixJ family response regulator
MIRVLIADDNEIIRRGLRALLDNEPDIEVVAEAEDGRQARQLAVELLPDVVLMDVVMPDLNGIEATKRILREAPEVRVIAISVHADRVFEYRMIKSGAKGYLLKDAALEDIAHAVREVAAGKPFPGPFVADSR